MDFFIGGDLCEFVVKSFFALHGCGMIGSLRRTRVALPDFAIVMYIPVAG
jgi:hypothetical protein